MTDSLKIEVLGKFDKIGWVSIDDAVVPLPEPSTPQEVPFEWKFRFLWFRPTIKGKVRISRG